MTRFSRGKGIFDVRRGPRGPGSGCTIMKLCFCPGGIIRITGDVEPSSHNRLRVAAIGRGFLSSGRLEIRLLNQKFT